MAKAYESKILALVLLVVILAALFVASYWVGQQMDIVLVLGCAKALVVLMFVLYWLTISRSRKLALALQKIEHRTADLQSNVATDDEKNAEHEATLIQQQEQHSARRVVIQQITAGLKDIRNPEKYFEKLLSNIAKHFEIAQGLAFVKQINTDVFTKMSAYAYYSEEDVRDFALGEGLSGQVAKSQEVLNVSNLPENYITIVSGLGKGVPRNMLIFPVVNSNRTLAVVELASFSAFDEDAEKLFEELATTIASEVANIV